MSAYRTLDTNMSNQECLVDSLKEMKFRGIKEGEQANPESHAEAQNLEGYHGEKRKDTAEIIIRRKEVGNASNDIGFKRGPDGNFKAIISQFDSSFHNEAWMKQLKQKYAEKHARKIANGSNLSFQGRTVTPQGAIKLTFKVGI